MYNLRYLNGDIQISLNYIVEMCEFRLDGNLIHVHIAYYSL